MVGAGFTSGGRGDDRSVHRTLAVGRHMLDMGYRSMVLDNVCSVLIYQPPRVTAGKLFFLLIALIVGAIAGAVFDISAFAIALGAIAGVLIGLVPFVPRPPTSLMITGSDGGAAVFESNDLRFLQRVKAFLDARINQGDLAMTGFFDFSQSRYSALRQEGVYGGGAMPDDEADDEDADYPPPLPPEPEPEPAPMRSAAPASQATPASETLRRLAEPQRPAAPAPAPAAPEPAQDDPAGDDDLDLAADDVSPRRADIHASAANGARAAHFEGLGDRHDMPQAPFAAETGDADADEDDGETQEETLPPIDFSRVMPQLAHVRRFYDETLQDADAVDQLDTMIVLMEEGAITRHARQRILEIASTMQEQVETYPSIASIFAGIASRVRV